MKNYTVFLKFITDASASVKDGIYKDVISTAIDRANYISKPVIGLTGTHIKHYLDKQGEDSLVAAYTLLEAYNKGKDISAITSTDVELKRSELYTLDAELAAASAEERDAVIACLGQKISVDNKEVDTESDSLKLSEKYKASKEALSAITEKMTSSLNETMSKMTKAAESLGEMPAYKPAQPTESTTSYASSASSQNSGWSVGKVLGVIAGATVIAGIAYAGYTWWNSDVVYGGDDLDNPNLGI